MTDRLAEVPLVALGHALTGSGRIAGWAFERYRQAPLTNSALALLVLVSALGAENALFGQNRHHPAPLFGTAHTALQKPQPVVPRTRPKTAVAPAAAAAAPAPAPQAAKPSPAEIASAAAEPGPTGNPDVFEVQRKLEKLKLFTGTVDGYYGPETAAAIRRFESLNGLPQTGKLGRDMMEKIKAAPLSLGDSREASVASADPAPAVTVPAADPKTASADLPAPAPLSATLPQPKPGVPLAVNDNPAPHGTEVPELTGNARPADVMPVSTTDPVIIAKVQRGLASLGFLQGPADGVAGEATSKAIRNFETYFNYRVTGRITPELLDLLVENGATI